jgi:tripartite-type tricarboxylate transporter receptor subunit TctC
MRGAMQDKIRISPVPLLAIAAVMLAGSAHGQTGSYPSRTVRVIVPWPAGGGTDMLARPIAQKLTELLAQQVVVDNRGGASGIVGSEIAAKASADGYTVMIDNVTSHATNATLYKQLAYNSLRDYAPVTLLTTVTNVIVVHPSVPVKSLQELVALARARPGQLSFATFGTGGTTHLAGEMLKGRAGIDMVHVPYKGGAPALVDAVAGHVPVYFSVFNTSLAQIKAGKLRPLATTGAERSALMLEVPTVAESGYPGFEANNWYGMLTPAGVPREILVRLNAETRKTLQSPDVIERLTAQGYEIVPSTPEKLREHMAMETEKWAKVIKSANVRAE